MSRSENIQVYIRMKPNGDKRSSIDVISDREIGLRDKCGKKSLSFARVFAPSSNQQLIYETVARPLVNDIISGYNCTLFAYGQSGSGKTFTMLGEKSSNNMAWEHEACAGLIPRCLSQILDEANRMTNEVIIDISSILIYNEELYDLLSSNEEVKLRIYDDSSKKGAVVVSGLESIVVRNKNQAFDYMERVFSRKEALTSSLNVCSSRLHTIFTINVTVKDNSIQREECFRFGKLCLVDLGGSDNSKGSNPDKAGWDSSRVNLSLLTLGRVINSLFTHSSHIPYRESKLTRVLRDSLGGSTKTCIIACVKPFLSDIDETVNTLDCMNKAKMIVNQPQINKKANVENLLMKYTEEIVRLRKDVEANKTETGVYLDDENYREMENKIITLQRTINELEKMKALQEEDARNKAIQQEILCKKLEEKEKKIDELIENFVEPYNEAKKQLEMFSSLFKQSTSQNMKMLGKVDQIRSIENSNKILIKRQLKRNNIKCAELNDKLKSYHKSLIQEREQLTESVIRHSDKVSHDRSELLNSMLVDAKETQAQILSSCQEKLSNTVRDILCCSEDMDNRQSAIVENLNTNKKSLEEFVNKEADSIVADCNLEEKFGDHQLKLKNLEDAIKSALTEVSKGMDGSTAKLKELVTSSKSEMTLMIKNLFINEMRKTTSLRAENNEKLEELGKQITANDEFLLRLQEHLHDQTIKNLISDSNITESISENEKAQVTAEVAFTKLIEKLNENLEMMDEFRQGFSEESKRATETLRKNLEDQNITAISSAIETLKRQDRSGIINERITENKENIAACITKIEQHSKLASKQNEHIKINSQNQLSLHNSIFNGELQKYKATGETPQRQEYKFPLSLAEMSPYQRNGRRLQTTINEDDLSE
ncbi:hypothetical protein LSTR_LSTR004769 [Laodelphax striatellus]|uniref:Kinesin motor domain-containing protein n=1 Tax=Laodelphax striatellus TaxID=195883 RepID=A0A482XJI2_LAOST|nr:hypothetical protein LSTR_LSTR004769 [Laodelphax striatellus]